MDHVDSQEARRYRFPRALTTAPGKLTNYEGSANGDINKCRKTL